MTLSWARRSQNKQTAQIPCKVERDGQMYFGDAELHWKRREKEKTNNPQTVKATKHSDRIQRDSSRCCLFFICNLGISGWFQRMSGTTTRQSSLAMDAGSLQPTTGWGEPEQRPPARWLWSPVSLQARWGRRAEVFCPGNGRRCWPDTSVCLGNRLLGKQGPVLLASI